MSMLALPQQLNHRNAAEWLGRIEQALSVQHHLTLDAAALQTFDSAALAVLLRAQRAAQANSKAMSLVNCPQRLSRLAQVYGAQELLH